VGHLPALGALGPKERQALLAQARVGEVPAGDTIVRHGEAGDAAYFVLGGQLVAGVAGADGRYHSLSSLAPGDFFGEIAALTGAARTANVVASEPARVMQVPAAALRGLMTHAAFSQLLLAKMSERLNRTPAADLPRLAGPDQQDMRELRTAPAED
jgi:CRP/FNR family transcriptional regulator, cyclic AMP receptor protein